MQKWIFDSKKEIRKYKRKKFLNFMKQTNMLSKRFKSIMVVDKKGKTKEIPKKNKRRNKPDCKNTTSIEITNVEDFDISSELKYSFENKEEICHLCGNVNKDPDEELDNTQSLKSSEKDHNKCITHDDIELQIHNNDSLWSQKGELKKIPDRSEKNIIFNVNEEISREKDDNYISLEVKSNGDSSSSDYKSIDEENSGDFVSLDDGSEINILQQEKNKEIHSEFIVFGNEQTSDKNKEISCGKIEREDTNILESLTLNDFVLPSDNKYDASIKTTFVENKLKGRNKGEKTIKRKFRRKDKMSEKNDTNSSKNKNSTEKKGLKDKIMEKASNVKESIQKKAHKMTGDSSNISQDHENSTQTQSTTTSKVSKKTSEQSGSASNISSRPSTKSSSENSSMSSRNGSSSTTSKSNSRSGPNSSAKQESMYSTSKSVSSTSNSKMRGCCCTNKGAKGDKKDMSSTSSSNVKKNLTLVNAKNKSGGVNSPKNESFSTSKSIPDDSKLSAQKKGKGMVASHQAASSESRDSNLDSSTQTKEKEMSSVNKDSTSYDNTGLVGGRNEEQSKESPKKDYSSYVKKYTNDPLGEDKIMVPETASSKKTSPKSSSAGKAAAAGVAGAAGAGIILGKGKDSGSPKSVSIDEDKNEEFEVKKDSNKSTPLSNEEKENGKSGAIQGTSEEEFVPMKISSSDLGEESEILKDRRDNNIMCEGHMWKRRRIFACFWHEKYFILDKEGILRYHKANGTKAAKGLWDIKMVHKVHEIFVGTENHPYRLAMICNSENLIFAFDDPDTREYWYKNFNSFINR